MRVRVTHTIDQLDREMRRIPGKAMTRMVGVTARSVDQGHRLAQGIAKKNSGPHGTNYWKRITSEMTGPLTGEFGPHGDVVGNAVGAGWRHGPPNTDLAKAADIIGPRFAKNVGKIPDKLFW